MSSTILIVDDNRDNLTVIGGLLKGEYHVRVANSGERALQVAVTQPIPDLILLDIMMPGMDGYETLRHLRQIPETRDIPVIFVTAMSADEDEEAGLHLGAVDYITKPIRPAILSARVRTHLALTQARQQLANQNARLESQVRRGMVKAGEHGGTGGGDAGHGLEERVCVADVLDDHHRQGREAAHHHPAGGGQKIHVARAQMGVLGPPGQHHQDPGNQADQAGPEEGVEVVAALEQHQGQHRDRHADGQGDEKDAKNETDDAQGRKGHDVGLGSQ